MSRRVVRCPNCDTLFEYDDSKPKRRASVEERTARVLEAVAVAGWSATLALVANRHNVSSELICSRTRSPVVAKARREVFRRLRRMGHTRRAIAEVFEVDKTTITHACNKERNR